MFSMRLAYLRPVNELNYWPSRIGDHGMLLEYTKAVLINHFARRQNPVNINFSPSFLTMSSNGMESHFKYASRSNFAALPVQYFIHDYESLNYFIYEILANFYLSEYFKKAVLNLSLDYEGVILPLSLCYHVSQTPSRVWGGYRKGTVLDRGLTTKKCCTIGWKNVGEDQNCIWRALSSKFKYDNGNVVKRISKPSVPSRPRQAIASKLKIKFLAYLKESGCSEFGVALTSKGLNERFLHIVEDFLKCKIVIYSERLVERKRLGVNGIKTRTGSWTRIVKVEYNSEKYFENEVVHLLSDGKSHIRRIFNPKGFSAKYLCTKCNQGFHELSKLKRHNNSDCVGLKYVSEQMYCWKRSIELEMETHHTFQAPYSFDNCYGHVLINETEDKFDVIIHVQLSEGQKHIFSGTFENIENIAEHLIKNVPKIVAKALARRLQENIQFLNELEAKLNGLKETLSADVYKTDESKKQYNSLLNVKNAMVDHLSSYSVYISCGKGNSKENRERVLFYALAKLASAQLNLGKFDLRYNKGRLSSVKKVGFPLKLISGNSLGLNSNEVLADESDIEEFESMVKLFKRVFKLNVVGLASPTEIGSRIMSDSLTQRDLVSFFSPSKELYKLMEGTVKFGILECLSGSIVHPDGYYRSFISQDFEKFYARILCTLDIIHVGQSLKYQKNDRGLYFCEPNRKRRTMANLVMLFIEHVIKSGEIRSALQGTEQIYGNHPIDGVLIGPKKSLISFDGCIWHPHDVICHETEATICMKDPGHQAKCQICINSVKKCKKTDLRFMPKLFKMNPKETLDSRHRIKKNKTYRQIFQENIEKRKLITEQSNLPHIVITECSIIEHYWHTVEEFMSSIGLESKESMKHMSFNQVFAEVAYLNFPLLKKRYLRFQDVLQGIAGGNINGYAVVSAECGSVSKNVLGCVKPFCYKNPDGKSCSSYSIEQKLVPMILLKELVSNEQLIDFKIKEISSIFEYKKILKNPFSDLKKLFIESLESNKENKVFTKLLKLALNGAIGVLAYSSSNNIKSHVVINDQIDAILHQKHISHGTKLTEESSILHLRDTRRIKNLSHIHYSIISGGKSIMINYVTNIYRFFGSNLVNARCNTDGLCLISHIQQTEANLKNENLTSLALDS